MSAATTVAAIAAIAGTGMQAISAYQQAQAQKDQYAYQAAVNRNNAIIAQQNADRIHQSQEVAEDEKRDKIKQTHGAANAIMAANGLLVDDTADSTASLLQQDIAEAGAYDILKIHDNYEQEARNAVIQGVNYSAQAGLDMLKSNSYNGTTAAAGSLLSGASTVYKAGKDATWWT